MPIDPKIKKTVFNLKKPQRAMLWDAISYGSLNSAMASCASGTSHSLDGAVPLESAGGVATLTRMKETNQEPLFLRKGFVEWKPGKKVSNFIFNPQATTTQDTLKELLEIIKEGDEL